jgi:hypothetical protein
VPQVKAWFWAGFLWLLVAGSAGCGYHFSRTGEPVGTDITSLAVPLMKSTSSLPGFEADFTRVIREEFISHARIPIVSESEAYAVLQGKVYRIETDPYTFSSTQTSVRGKTVEYDVTSARWISITVDFKLVERSTGKVIWQEKGMKERAWYYVTADPLADQYYQRKAVEEMADRLAKRAYLMTMQRF